MKEQDKVTNRDLSKTDVSYMPNGEFKETIIRTLTRLAKRMKEFRETLTTEIKE